MGVTSAFARVNMRSSLSVLTARKSLLGMGLMCGKSKAFRPEANCSCPVCVCVCARAVRERMTDYYIEETRGRGIQLNQPHIRMETSRHARIKVAIAQTKRSILGHINTNACNERVLTYHRKHFYNFITIPTIITITTITTITHPIPDLP